MKRANSTSPDTCRTSSDQRGAGLAKRLLTGVRFEAFG